jgi:hypothetical protein
MTADDNQLRDSMWDLVYGLLSDDESQALIARIKSDPQAARLYAEVRLQVDLVGQAARVEDSALVLKPESARHPVAAKASLATPPSAAIVSRTNPPHAAGAWLAGLAATALAALLAVGFFWPRSNERLLARNFVAIDVTGPRSMQAGLTNQIALHTYSIDAQGQPGEGVPASVELTLLDGAGQVRLHEAVQTNEIGQATVAIPGEALQPGVRLEIARSKPSSSEHDADVMDTVALSKIESRAKQQPDFSADLYIQPEPQMAYFLVAEPAIEPSKQVPFLWSFSAFTSKPSPAEQSQAALNKVEQLAISETAPVPDGQPGVVNGALEGKEDARPPTPTRQSTAGASALALDDLRLRRAVPALNAPAAPIAPPLAGRELAQRQAAKLSESNAQAVQAGQAGGERALAEAERLTTIAAGQPISVSIPSDLVGKDVLAAAVCRGVTVGTASLDENKSRGRALARESGQAGGQQLSLSLPPEADGLIEVEFFDRSANTKEPAHRQYVYREPQRKLKIELPDLSARFAPGEEVQLSLQVTDENGQPAPDTRLGVRIWNEQFVRQSIEPVVLLADAVHSGRGEVVRTDAAGIAINQKELTAVGDSFALGNDPLLRSKKESKDADEKPAESNEPVLPAAPQLVELASNRDSVKGDLRQAAQAAEAKRERTLAAIGGAAIFGAAAVLVLIAILAALRMASSVRIMLPALATAMASLLLGLMWTGWIPQDRWKPIAMARAAPAAVQQASDESASVVSDPAAKDAAQEPSVPALAALPPADPTSAATASRPTAAEALSDGAPAATPAPVPLPAEPQPQHFARGFPAESSAARDAGAAPAGPLGAAGTGQSPPASAIAPTASAPTLRALNQLQDNEKSSPAVSAGGVGGASSRGGSLGKAIGGKPIGGGQLSGRQLSDGQLGDGPTNDKAKPAAGVRFEEESFGRKPLEDKAAAKSEAPTAPAALYFNPQLMTDSTGRATIRFTMPPVNSEYLLLIDALGQGRIGSRQQTLVCGDAVAK